jgi:soluble lytic murein transglycosylase
MKFSLLLFSGFLFACAHAPAMDSQIKRYKEARAMERFQPDKACETYKALSQKKNFALQDLSFIRQGLICEDPLLEAPFDEAMPRPWLASLNTERKLRLAMKKKDLLEIVSARCDLAQFEWSKRRLQKSALAMLDETDALIKKDPASKEIKQEAFEKVQKMRERIAPRFIKNPQARDFLSIAQDFLGAREFGKARQMARKVMKDRKSSIDDLLSARRILRGSYKVEQNTEAYLKSLADDWAWIQKQKFPGKAVDLGILYSKALWTEGKNDKARRILNEVEKKYAKTMTINEIPFVRGKMAEEKKNWTGALAEYEKATLDLRNSLDKKIQFAKAWVAWKSEQWDKANESLDALIALGQDDPFESSRALFWKARVLKKQKKDAEAKALFKQLQTQDPVGYYGTLAYFELNENFPPLKAIREPVEFRSSDFVADRDVVQALWEAGETEILQHAMGLLLVAPKSDSPDDSLPFVLAAARANAYLPLFSKVSLLAPEKRFSLLEKNSELIFPLDFADLIKEWANKFEVPPELVFSIIRQESAFNPLARSPADAMGLMQILPSVSQAYFKQVGLKVEHFEDLFLPDLNIPYGVALLKELLQKYDRKIYLAAAAYNASEKALRNWLKMRWNGDAVEFIEEIPYEETRAYVKLIIRNYAFYSRLLRPNEPTPFPKACLGD